MIIIPNHLKGNYYCGSKRILLDDSMSVADAKLIMSETPSYGVQYIEQDVKPKSRKKK